MRKDSSDHLQPILVSPPCPTQLLVPGMAVFQSNALHEDGGIRSVGF